jgi:hypothetical protein
MTSRNSERSSRPWPALRSALGHAESIRAARIGAVQERHRYSAANLVHYTELRRHDIRELQAELAGQGLSSLGRTEDHVMASLDTLIYTLTRLVAPDADAPPAAAQVPDGAELLARNAANLLGPEPEEHTTRIMVTLPTEAADDPALVRDMIENGMDIARINCAHDRPEDWARMAAHIRSAEEETGRRCLITMDLAGPKLRTGPIRPGPQVLRAKPVRSKTGTVTAPGRVWLGERPPADSAIPLVPLDEPSWAAARRPGDRISLVDGRGSRRSLVVQQADEHGCLAALTQTVYFTPGLELRARTGKRGHGAEPRTARVGPLAPLPEALLVHRGDRIVLTEDLAPADYTTTGTHRIGCTLPEALRDVRRPADVRALLAHLDDPSGRSLGVVLKIDSMAAFGALPQILLELMKWSDIGIMIARGDLAVEAGYERLAEVQEEILWLCEAAHAPVIWVTQVLDTVARTGRPSRAEVTDAAMAERAECVMLNKGPYINEAITMLAEILPACRTTPRRSAASCAASTLGTT